MTLQITGLSKTFPGQTALRSVDLRADFGEVHALVGQNGSGKSTLIKVLSGYHEPDPGASATIDGRPFQLGHGAAARAVGLRFVHQDLGLVLSLSVLENMMLGQPYPTGLGRRIRWGESARRVRLCLDRLGLSGDVSVPVSELSLAERTGVAIARALMDTEGERLMLVLDEPTAALPPDEVARLLDVIGRLRAEGHGVVLVSHHLDEVLQISDRITVLRDGSVVASVGRGELDHDRLTELIVGHVLADAGPGSRDRPAGSAGGPAARAGAAELAPVLQVAGLSGARVEDVDLSIRPGEILGVAGITGSGRESLGPLLSGRLARRGTVSVGGRVVPGGDPRRALAAGVASIPGERGQFGVFPAMSVRANTTIAALDRHRRIGRISRGLEQQEVNEWIRSLGIVTQGTEAPMSSLSGGNQQKVLVARALRLSPSLLVLDDPTLGIDIGARAQIHEVIRRCAAEGKAVLLISTDSDELAALSDRVLVMARGRVARTLEGGPELTPEKIDLDQLTAAKG
ncbi:MAG TPA: sugar ABC transporter ATP-binding protein [Acidimicrobiales bacterium]